ncbi:MAG TPA: EAL domain-containing protein, partial [Gammaproteobacteria bacterium]
HLALHDTLTGLANREQLARVITQALGNDAQPCQELALLLIGLNRFREINNSLGHSVGDHLLIAVAERLTTSFSGTAIFSRLNGDEFALLLTGEQCASADLLANELIKTLESPFEVDNQSLYISATIGIALSPEHGATPQELLQKAEVAMDVAKRRKLPLTHYNSEHDRHAKRRLALANTLRHELHAPINSLSLAYQPQVEIRTGRFCGMEALLRWAVPGEGIVSPEEIVPIAENTGLIYHLTPWVLERAFEEFSSLKNLHLTKPVLSANLSALNLHDADFPRRLERLMEKWAIAPASLQLEITESAMMADPARAQRTLAQIHAMGVELAIDDFGTGFSSLSYLKHLPVSKLKIDKSFVMSMLRDENDAVIIRSTIDMAHNMGLWVVAEGVENQETFDLLEILDCDIAQGYLISTPLDMPTLEKWIDTHVARTRQRQPFLAEC